VRYSRVVLAALSCLLMAGCDSAPEADSPDTPSPAATESVPTLADPSGPQPVDSYQAEKLGQVEYAQLLIRNTCLAEAGYPQNLNTMMEYRPQGNYLRFHPSNYLGFASEEDARERGMNRDKPAEPPYIISFDPDYDAALEQCEAQAWSSLGDDARATYEAYVNLGSQVNDVIVARVRPVLRAGVASLIDCLEQAGFGFRGTDEERAGVGLLNLAPYFVTTGHYEPTQEDWEPERIPGTVQVSPPVVAQDWIPSPEERELAVAVYRCDQQTRRLDEAWAAHYAAQVEAVGRFETTFAELNPKLDALAAEASAIIAAR
jgi:hypothetical protein